MTDWSFVPGTSLAFVSDGFAVMTSGERSRDALSQFTDDCASVEAALDALTASGISNAPDFCICTVKGGRVSAVIRGNVTLRIEGDWTAASTVSGEDVRTWKEVAFEGVSRAAIIPSGSGIDSTATTREIHARPAPAGTYGVSALKYEHTAQPTILDRAERIAKADAFPDHLFGETVEHDFAPIEDVTVLARGTSTHSTGELSAATCRDGHPNPPERQDCVVCAAPLENGSLVRVSRTRMGMMSIAGQSDVAIEGDVLIGRSPRGAIAESTRVPDLVSVTDPSGDVSRTHARVFVEGWTVLIEDLNSTNGTVLVSSSGSVQLRPGEPVIVSDGDVAVLAGTIPVKFRGIA